MSGLLALPNASSSRLSARSKDDWEDWEDDEVITPITPNHGPLTDLGPERTVTHLVENTELPEPQPTYSQRASSSTARQSTQKIRRLRSRRRQKAQNAMAGIRLVTDMSKFRQEQQHMPQQMRLGPDQRPTGKFVDFAALRALEGSPSDDSIGTFAWLKRKGTKSKRVERLIAESSSQADLSPSARPIVIGFEMPTNSDVVISPQTAVVETPADFPRYFKPAQVTSPSQPVSAWSPDTEDGASPRAGTTGFAQQGHVPAVPSIPSYYKATEASPLGAIDNNDGLPASKDRKNYRDTVTTPIYVSDEDDDMATPVTLFEEDGSPATTHRKSLRAKGRQRSATGGSSRSQGWWDQVTSPFGPPTPASPREANPSQQKPDQSQAWWRNMDKKSAFSPASPPAEAESSSTAPRSVPKIQHRPPEIIIEDMSSSAPSSSMAVPTQQQETSSQSEKPRALFEEVPTPGEQPPPYSPPKAPNARYRAVFPPGHPLNTMYPPSPGPVPPGLAQTMTSQGAISLAEVPETPLPTHQLRLPDRPLGSFVPGDHFQDVSGHGPRQKAERRRRRHEKEDAVAWKAGRFCHDRGCFPCCCCIGRPGREGRKRRRICLGICMAMMLVLIGVGVTLGVLLTRRAVTEAVVPSQWLNLTNFPPIPTGISTIIGPESDAVTACVQPPTLWSCALPKEEASSVAPFEASQPSFVFQIQFDNNTRQLWNVTGDPPRPTPTDLGNGVPLPRPNSSTSATPTATASPRSVPNTGFTSLVRRVVLGPRDEPGSSLILRSDPPPPTFQEMFFLGNTTDGVISPDKAGEPTPFYISILRSVNSTVGPNLLSRRQADGTTTDTNYNSNITSGGLNVSDVVPPPLLDKDGTGAAAILLAFPTQQPVRLYDRGLPTERYGFYTYFNKTTYLKSLDSLSPGEKPVPADLDGGSLKSEARWVITWLSVRYKVEIWTRMANTTRLVGRLGGGAASDNTTQPGSFPYPVTVTLDTHGGERGRKYAFVRGVDDRGRIRLDDAKFVLNDMNNKGDLVNPAGEFNPSFGGMDGGTGGCRCEWRNWVGLSRGR
ncbi:hypothetical protein VTI74DRAFT_1703 [Chaetomium olivicolor]